MEPRVRSILSSSAAVRLDAARRFLAAHEATEVLIVGASRAAADDLARDLARRRRATFGLHRLSVTQLAARLAAPRLARAGLAPATTLGIEAVAARALAEVSRDAALSYFAPVAGTPGFHRALARTLEELSLAMVRGRALSGAGAGGADLALLLDRFEREFAAASTVDRAVFLRVATEAVQQAEDSYVRCRLVLLDVPVTTPVERAFLRALVWRAPAVFATIPAGDETTRAAFAELGPVDICEPVHPQGLDRVRQQLFAATPLPDAPPLDEVELFSAPGEGRESVEIARRVLAEAQRGVPFDRMAIALRAVQHYAGQLEHALARAGVPAYFERGTRRPHPAGRAFLALLRCALENLSAGAFAEYVSLGQIPPGRAPAGDPLAASSDEVFGATGARDDLAAAVAEDVDDPEEPETPASQALRSPWRWERLLAESRVIASADRWERRLNGLARECEVQMEELRRTDPDSARLDRLRRRAADIEQFASFALPLVDALSGWPSAQTWAGWLDAFAELAPRVLRRPDRVLRVLADLRPMNAVGPVTLAEAASVLADRLATVEADPPRRRFGRVLITTPALLRGRSFEVVFVPALAERLFPQKPREDPLLLDDARARIADAADGRDGLPTQSLRGEQEKLQLQLAVGAAESRLYVSFPTIEIGEGRPRVPSLYALEVWRAMTGRVPGADELQQAAARVSRATLAWPAPVDRERAIDPLEHDLSTLRALVAEPEARARGRAQYMLRLNASLQRSVRARYVRTKRAWSRWDGIASASERLAPVLEAYRLGARPYSLSALQKYAVCPYQFLLAAMCRLQPAEDVEPLYRMDPLTRGSLFHAVQTRFYRGLKAVDGLHLAEAHRSRALAILDDAVKAIADEYREQLAPAFDRVWHAEVAAIRRDLRLWVDDLLRADDGWTPKWFEWSFGLSDKGRDEASRSEPVTIAERFHLRGSIDLVEERASGELRVTDHKTGRYRGKDTLVVGGGAVLQPTLYALVLEAATGQPVVEGRLYFATADGGFKKVPVPLTPAARRAGVEVLEIVDRAIATGFLAPVPAEKACTWCDFRPVCGPDAERSSRHKAREPLRDLVALRSMP